MDWGYHQTELDEESKDKTFFRHMKVFTENLSANLDRYTEMRQFSNPPSQQIELNGLVAVSLKQCDSSSTKDSEHQKRR